MNKGITDPLEPRTFPNRVVINLVFPFPPEMEQQQIVEYLDEQTQIIDTTITKEQKRIELLKEYREIFTEIIGKPPVYEAEVSSVTSIHSGKGSVAIGYIRK